MMRSALPVGPTLILMSCAAAFAQEVPQAVAAPAVALPVPVADPSSYFMTLGPIGALVWGAYVLGKGLKLTLNIKLDETDRKLIERGVEAMEKKA